MLQLLGPINSFVKHTLQILNFKIKTGIIIFPQGGL